MLKCNFPILEIGRAGRRLGPIPQKANIIGKLGKDYQVIKNKTGNIIGLEEKGYSLLQTPNGTLIETTERPNYLYQITYNNGAITSLLEKEAGKGGFYIMQDLNGEILSTKIPPSKFL